MKRSRLRTYAPMKRRSLKVQKAEPDYQAVYRLVDLRSEGRCEVLVSGSRCARRAMDHHHAVKPRRRNHSVGLVLHVCRTCHDRMAWPYLRGRLCWIRGFLYEVRYASDKWAARQPTTAP